MPEIYTSAQTFRAALLKRERGAALRLIRAYGLIWKRLQRRLRLLTDRIEAARAAGEPIGDAWLFRQERYRELIEQVVAEVTRFAEFAGREITAEQRRAIKAARKDAERLLLSASGPSVEVSFNRVPSSAVESMVGFLSDGSPLTKLLGELPGDASRKVSATLQEAVALGYNPRKTARQIRSSLGGNLTRALRISRTETLRAYREATRSSYQENSDIISGWRWTASKSARTCLACLSKDGTIYPLNKPMPQHPNCRCTMVAVLIDAPLPDIETGAAWFDRQPDAVKAQMMPKIAFDAYREGSITLKDFEGHKHHPRWGESVYQRSYREITQFPRVVRAAGA